MNEQEVQDLLSLNGDEIDRKAYKIMSDGFQKATGKSLSDEGRGIVMTVIVVVRMLEALANSQDEKASEMARAAAEALSIATRDYLFKFN